MLSARKPVPRVRGRSAGKRRSGRGKAAAAHPAAKAPAAVAKPQPSQWRSNVPASQTTPKRVFLTCRYCAYSPPTIPPDGVCPKCGGGSWQRYALSAKALKPKPD